MTRKSLELSVDGCPGFDCRQSFISFLKRLNLFWYPPSPFLNEFRAHLSRDKRPGLEANSSRHLVSRLHLDLHTTSRHLILSSFWIHVFRVAPSCRLPYKNCICTSFFPSIPPPPSVTQTTKKLFCFCLNMVYMPLIF